MSEFPEVLAPTDENRTDDRFIGKAELAHRICVDVRTVSRMVKRGELPQPCIGHGGRPRWLWSYVVAFCRKRHERMTRQDKRMK